MHISKDGFSKLAVLLGATASLASLLIIPICAFLIDYENHVSDGPIKGLVTLIMISPIIWFITLVYFSALSFFQVNRVLPAITISTLLAFAITYFMVSPIWVLTDYVFIFLTMAISLNVGVLVWYKKSPNKPLKQDK